MHPEIKNYFEDRGAIIWNEYAPNDYVEFYQIINKTYTPIALWSPETKWEYCLNGNWFSERDALRLVKLKAFL